jgi:hypothetical protein
MEDSLDDPGDLHRVVIEGRAFIICTERLYKEASEEFSGEWHAWCFFAYDKDINIYPAGDIPIGVRATESIAGKTANNEEDALAGVEQKLKNVMRTRSLDGTGFLSPKGYVYPQEMPEN